MVEIIKVKTGSQGLYEFTAQLQAMVRRSGLREGLCSLLIQHTSASLTIQENADPSARIDLENWLSRLVPENDPLYTHVFEGEDDMPAHIKAALTSTTLSIPVIQGELALGTWQGVYCWEHRHQADYRKIAVHLGG
ncbi:secondary thiamine-phosphate synthase enzyme YjbQ [Marinobacterium jannaschii]|uniref:secondary thiamine-phosphate synthase enzyme YjbQ n=1 Tax=Marinobacterium jannaschii TaxID=64970 RepID=UPI000485912C|nr:secondary thiamine-phosphate synthase enzyme YjbQ [Marinobacterium jannaschii]